MFFKKYMKLSKKRWINNTPQCQKPDCRRIKAVSNQHGQAVVELALMMTFLAMILMALIIFYEIVQVFGKKRKSYTPTIIHKTIFTEEPLTLMAISP